MRHLAKLAGGLTVGAMLAGAALAQDAAPFGGQEDQDYAAKLWTAMVEARLAGEDAVRSFP